MPKGLILLTTWSFLLLVGCSSVTKQQVSILPVPAPLTLPSLNTEIFDPISVPTKKDIFALTEKQKTDFLRYYHDPKNQQTQGHIRLFDYLDTFVNDFGFRGATLRASEALFLKTGNCLSLAIVTKALADVVNLETAFQRVHSAPVYARNSRLMTLSSHVRTFIYDPNFAPPASVIVVRRPSIIIDYFPSRSDVTGVRVSQADFMAMYYQNVAAEALLNKQLDHAYSLLQKGLSFNPLNTETLNTLAVTFNRAGDPNQAEVLYQFMLDNGLASGNVISNYVALLQSQGREIEVTALEQKVDAIDDDNPYRWIDLGEQAFAENSFTLANKYYKKAENIAPYLHEAYFGLAKSYYQLGRQNLSEKALTRAIELTYNTVDKSLYEAKLHTLVHSNSN
ncbi:tetratricopeptide repeat protein [Flavobacterium sp. W21_SRS_FM6]|uniref:tetratricopeptide repeat protein n=1 Tax=Flavobacterium sp. W21_SRS_FM6 TaxID=3240268 RepID=UPI003F90EF29